MFDSLFENLCSWNDDQWQLHTDNEPITTKPVDNWQQRHNERFKDYTSEDWKQEMEMQRLEVLRIRS